MEEKIFFEAENVSVSNSRFIVKGQTYVMSNVTSVKTGVEKAKKSTGIYMILAGLFVLFNVQSVLWGCVLIAFGILAFIGAKEQYSVILCTSSGETEALTSEDKLYIEKVMAALNHSIVSRG